MWSRSRAAYARTRGFATVAASAARRADPRLPVEHLPADWPAVRAQRVVTELRDRYGPAARLLADEAMEFIPLR